MRSTVKILGVASLLTIFGLGTANAADVLIAPPPPAPVKKKLSLAISGQVNKGILYANDGNDGEVFFVDNQASGSRFRFILSGTLNDDLSVGARIEASVNSNPSNGRNFGDVNGAGAVNDFLGRRYSEIYATSKSMGKVYLGHGEMATDGIATISFAGTGIAGIGNGGIGDLVGAGIRGNDFYGHLGGGRRDRVRYDTPAFAGFKASVAAASGGGWDVALRYANQIGGAKFAAGIGYGDDEGLVFGVQDNERISGSASVLLDNGFNATVAAGDQKNNASYIYLNVGFVTNSVSMYGKTSFSIDYYQSDSDTIDQDGQTYGFGVVQNIDPIGTEVYFGIKATNADGAGADDVIAAIVGARLSF